MEKKKTKKSKTVEQHKAIKHKAMKHMEIYLEPPYALREITMPIPTEKIPNESLPARAAYQLVSDQLSMDCNPKLNLASFVTTWMEPEAVQLYTDTAGMNYIDIDTYEQSAIIHQRCMTMTAELFNAPDPKHSWGTATGGSSEAIMLGLLAHKWNWRQRREKEGLDTTKPNIVFGAHAHTVVEKFAVYFDVEARIVPLRDPDKIDNKDVYEADPYVASPLRIKERIDENTIAVVAIVGSTFTGATDNVKAINDLLMEINKEKGWDIPLHVDAASGGFVVPFINPDTLCDFRLDRVKSINVSNHKFGLVYAGMGSVIFRSTDDLPQHLRFHISYLGGNMENYSLNFSRPASIIVLQYYQFLRLGKFGYKRIMDNLMATAAYLEEQIEATGAFISLSKNRCIPIVVVKAKDEEKHNVKTVSAALRKSGWMLPAYYLPPEADKVHVMRIVVKETFGKAMADTFMSTLRKVLKELEGDESPARHVKRANSLVHPVC